MTELEIAVSKIYEAVSEAEAISNKTGEGFNLSIVWGMGGYYDPEDTSEYTDNHWFPSSTGC